VLHALPIT